MHTVMVAKRKRQTINGNQPLPYSRFCYAEIAFPRRSIGLYSMKDVAHEGGTQRFTAIHPAWDVQASSRHGALIAHINGCRRVSFSDLPQFAPARVTSKTRTSRLLGHIEIAECESMFRNTAGTHPARARDRHSGELPQSLAGEIRKASLT